MERSAEWGRECDTGIADLHVRPSIDVKDVDSLRVCVHQVERPIVDVVHVEKCMRLRTACPSGCGLHLREILILLAELVAGRIAAWVQRGVPRM